LGIIRAGLNNTEREKTGDKLVANVCDRDKEREREGGVFSGWNVVRYEEEKIRVIYV